LELADVRTAVVFGFRKELAQPFREDVLSTNVAPNVLAAEGADHATLALDG
jgi:hypothetical protein